MKALKKSTLASLVGAAALATAGAANATIVVGGADGYEFSVDGNINQFFIQSDQDSANGFSGQDNSQVANGLLPTFFGFNVSAPEINGLKVGARVSISPSTNNGSYFGEDTGAMEQREAFATVDGSFGQIMMGKGLGLYSANNILLDQTLFGVGATGFTAAGDQNTGTTSLGRIGWGYDYAFWRSQIRWTSPDMNGFQVAAAVVDADETNGDGLSVIEKDPRFEASLSYATDFDNGSVKFWLDGMTQEVKVSDAGFANTANTTSEKSNAMTLGGQLILGGFEAVASYYDNEGVGVGGGLLTGTAFDANGKARDGDGYYVQAGYRFGGKTLVSLSTGESTLDLNSNEDPSNFGRTVTGVIDENTMHTIGIYHDVTQNLKLVAEYSQMETEYHSSTADDDEVDVISLGGFISW